jgi:hypothetical protein
MLSPPEGARSLVIVVLDSCRFDSFMRAELSSLRGLGEVQERFSYASWTPPAHYNLFMGLLPHASPTGIHASTAWKRDLAAMADRLGIPELGFATMLPQLWLPHTLREDYGYHTQAIVSMPVLNPATPLATGFDRYEMAERHNDLGAIADRLVFPTDRPSFTVINTGETHFPYASADEPRETWPRIEGIDGVFEQLSAGQPLHQSQAPRALSADRVAALHQRQVRALSRTNRALEALLDRCPPHTWVVITSDHGELFGEGGYLGHGPIVHEKVLAVPLLEGLIHAS